MPYRVLLLTTQAKCGKLCSSLQLPGCSPDGKYYVGQLEHRQPLLSIVQARMLLPA